MIAIPVDFDKPAKELKLYFIDNFADALSIKLKFVAADKGLYDAKMHDALIKERTKTANKGDTATGATKFATIETGYQIKVPLFIEEGEVVVVNTVEGKYSGRA